MSNPTEIDVLVAILGELKKLNDRLPPPIVMNVNQGDFSLSDSQYPFGRQP